MEDQPSSSEISSVKLTRILKILICIFCLTLLFLLINSLLQPGIFQGHDTVSQLRFIRGFKEAFLSGQFPVRFVNGPYPGFSAPIFNFYQPGFYYLFLVPNLMGFSNLMSLKLTIFSLWTVSGVFMFLFTRKFVGNLGGIVAAFFYILAPYHIVQLFVRSAFGEFATLAFIPAVFWGVSTLWEKTAARYFFLTSIFFALFLISHTVTIIIFVPVLVCFIFFLFIEKRNIQALISSTWSLLLGLGIASFFLIPAFLEMKYTNLSSIKEGVSDFHLHFVCFNQLFSNQWGYGGSFLGCSDTMPFTVGVVHWLAIFLLIILMIFILIRKKKSVALSPGERLSMLFLPIFLYSVFMATGYSAFIWEKLPFISFLQYPWRFLTLAVFASSILAGGFIYLLKNNRAKYLLAVILMFLALLFYAGKLKSVYISEEFFNFNGENFMLGREYVLRDYLTLRDDLGPIWEQKRMPLELIPKNEASVSSGKAQIITERLDPGYKRYQIQAEEDSKVRFFTHYFPGWKVSASGQEITPFYENGYGYMDVNFPKGNYDVALTFKNTPVRATSQTISTISLITLCLSTIFLKLFSKRQNL